VPVPDFRHAEPGRKTENLENLKTDIQTGDTAHQDSRFSGFQVFTHTAARESGWVIPGWGEGCRERLERQVYAQNRTVRLG
jgi:hypothetical protein